MKRLLSGLISILLLLSLLPGCAEEEKPPAPIGSEVWETMPQLTYGVMEYEKLQILPWNSGRCEATSFNTMVETEKGYYMPLKLNFLCYADKAEMGTWIPVCNQPNCNHDDRCSSYRNYEEVVARDGKLYGQVCAYDIGLPVDMPPYPGMLSLVSMDPDGSNRTMAAELENFPTSTTTHMPLLTSHYWLYNVVELNPDGSQTARFFRLTESGWNLETEIENYEGTPQIKSAKNYPLYGDPVFYNGMLNPARTVYFRYRNNVLEELNLATLPATGSQNPMAGSYLSGDILRFFRMNDGYYDVNIKTGEEVRLGEAQLENSFACVVLPNCILESTLLAYTVQWTDSYYFDGRRHEMRLFDGERWRTVELPRELLLANGLTYIRVVSVTSDSIIFFSRDMVNYRRDYTSAYYKIDLTNEELKAEFFMAFNNVPVSGKLQF